MYGFKKMISRNGSFTVRTLHCFIKLSVFFVLTAALFTSCTEPSPLHGSWADNKGNTFSFFTDNTFIAKIYTSGSSQNYEGNFSLLRNVLTLDCTNANLRIVTEWDIRGNILYLYWTTSSSEVMTLRLFKVSN